MIKKNFNNITEDIEGINRFATNNPTVLAAAYNFTRDIERLLTIYENLPLFNLFNNASGKKYINLTDALSKLRPHLTLVLFTEIDFYGLYDGEQLANLYNDYNNMEFKNHYNITTISNALISEMNEILRK